MSTEELNNATKDLSLEEKKDVTALENSEEFNVKHPLNSKWTLWYTKPPVDTNESWSDLLKPVVTFNTVEEFWGIFHAIPTVNELPPRSDYHLFRDDIKPEWEDSQNSDGGKWYCQFKGKRDDLNELWTRTLLSVIGETIEKSEDEINEVNGVVFNVRKNNVKIGLWTKSCDEQKLKAIGEVFKKVLKLGEDEKIEFLKHKDSDIRGAKPSLVM
jgi:translation initiation factor 4E